jgi:hypothetical protein
MLKGKGITILLLWTGAPWLGLSLIAPSGAWAHHGRDFLNCRTAEVPHQGQLYFVPGVDYIDVDGESEFEVEPTLLAGLMPWLAVELHGHIAKEEGESWEYESTGPTVQLRLNPPEQSWGGGLSAEYEASHLDEGHDRVEIRGLFSTWISQARLAGNFTADKELDSGEDMECGYVVGFRSKLANNLDWGIEGQGTFESDSIHEGLVDLFWDATDGLAVNVGVGSATGSEEAPDLTARTAIVWRLRG